jgi:DNA-binding CsgD family transcriptional regulator
LESWLQARSVSLEFNNLKRTSHKFEVDPMPNRPPSEVKPPPAGRESQIPSTDQLIRLLAGLALKSEAGQLAGMPEADEEILVDAELDGFRYLLVRLPKPASSRVALSPREQEIVRMVAQGHPNKVIAGVLNISGWTVCTHLRRIFAKLGVNSRAAMVARLLDIRSAKNCIRMGPEAAEKTAPTIPGAMPAANLREKLAARASRRQ